MKYCIAIDGGGTKTDAVLFDSAGNIITRFVGPGNNPTDLGCDEALKRMIKTLDAVYSYAPGAVDALFGGVAGTLPNGDIYSDTVRKRYNIRSIRFEDDGYNLISGAFGHADGCGMVCGTGSSLFVRREGQPLRHIGGKGYLIDTGGSGFELGREAIREALRAVDGRRGSTVLVDLLAGIIGRPIDDGVTPIVHRGGRPYIASFAKAVFEGRRLGDKACEEIFQRQAALMADLTYAAQTSFDGDFNVVAGGGIVSHYPEYFAAIKEKSAPGAKLVLQYAPPAYGAAVEAMWDAGESVTDGFKTRFLAQYAREEEK